MININEIFMNRALREKDDVQSRIRTISVLAVLLQGPFDTGNTILGSQNLVDLMIQMAGSKDPLQEVIINFLLEVYFCLFFISVLQLKQLFYQHQKRIKQLEFYHKVQIFLRISIDQQMKILKSLLLW